jgi:hypothetical protein
MRLKHAVTGLVVAISFAATSVAFAQTNTAAQPPVESAQAAKIKAPHRERTTLRPGTTTGMSRDTPGARRNWYKGSN